MTHAIQGARADARAPAGDAAASRITAELVPTTPAREAPAAAVPALSRPAGRGRGVLRAALMLGGIVVVLAAVGIVWLRGGRYAATDDAFVQAAKLSVSTDVSGLVSSVDVREGQAVAAGDVLFRIDPREFEIALADATANLQEVALTVDAMKADYRVLLSNVAAQEAQASIDRLAFDRAAALVSDDTVSRETYDIARYTLEASRSTLEAMRHQAEEQLARLGGSLDLPTAEHPLYLTAQAQVDEARRELDHATVRAPFGGVVTQVDALQPGTYLVAQTAALTNAGAVALVATDGPWVTANMKETDLTHVRAGDPVDIYVDTYPGLVWSGMVDAISPASGAEFAILPPQNTSGNWVKVVQRIPVRITITDGPADVILRAGMSATVEIDTGHRRSLRDLL